MKKTLSLLLALVMVFALSACGQEKKDEAPAGDVEMKYMTADETVAILGTDGYTILDLSLIHI